MPRYRKLATSVDAERIDWLLKNRDTQENWSEWFREAFRKGKVAVEHNGVYVKTNIGSIRASRNEVLVREENGDMYLFPGENFEDYFDEEDSSGTQGSDQSGEENRG
jgi:hypothetical protein